MHSTIEKLKNIQYELYGNRFFLSLSLFLMLLLFSSFVLPSSPSLPCFSLDQWTKIFSTLVVNFPLRRNH